MSQYECFRMCFFGFLKFFFVNTLMYMAESIIENKVLLWKLACHETTKVLIRDKEDIFIRKILHDLQCIGRCYTYVWLCFDLCGWVHITDYRYIRVFISHFPDLIYVYHVCHRTVCMTVCHYDSLLWIQDLRTFSHERDSTENNRALRNFGCNLCKIIRVSYIVCNLLHFPIYIIMCQDYSIFFLFQFLDFIFDFFVHFRLSPLNKVFNGLFFRKSCLFIK